MKNNNVKDAPLVNLVVVAHPDDEILGFGATGALLSRLDEIVQPIILCGHADARMNKPEIKTFNKNILAANKIVGFQEPILGSFPNIKINTIDHLSLVQFIEKNIECFMPTRIFTHHPNDINDDHIQVSKACMAASRYFQRRPGIKPLQSLYFMEILSSTDWAFPHNATIFQPNTFVEIEDTLEDKILALRAYENVMRDFPHPRSEEIIRGIAAYRGGQSGKRYAESFQCVYRDGL